MDGIRTQFMGDRAQIGFMGPLIIWVNENCKVMISEFKINNWRGIIFWGCTKNLLHILILILKASNCGKRQLWESWPDDPNQELGWEIHFEPFDCFLCPVEKGNKLVTIIYDSTTLEKIWKMSLSFGWIFGSTWLKFIPIEL